MFFDTTKNEVGSLNTSLPKTESNDYIVDESIERIHIFYQVVSCLSLWFLLVTKDQFLFDGEDCEKDFCLTLWRKKPREINWKDRWKDRSVG